MAVAFRVRAAAIILNIQITFTTREFANANGFISELDVEGIAVNCGMNCNGGNSHFFTGAENTEGNSLDWQLIFWKIASSASMLSIE